MMATTAKFSSNFDSNRLVPPFPVTPPALISGAGRPVNISSYISNNAESMPGSPTTLATNSMQLRRPSSFYNNEQQPVYGYAIVQRPYLVPISSSTVYMSCYTTINNNEAHYYVNGDFLAEKLRLEEEELEEVDLFFPAFFKGHEDCTAAFSFCD